jgi:GNAT superfamily N-acetyltransferase
MSDSVVAGKAGDFTEAERREFMRLVQQGGEVDDIVLARNIDAARRLVFLRSSEGLIGVAALKMPQASYRKRISGLSGVEIPEGTFPLELGYVFVVPAQRNRGLSRRLVEAALDGCSHDGVFATSRADNGSMHHTLERFDFRATGKPYAGREQVIQLFVRQGR